MNVELQSYMYIFYTMFLHAQMQCWSYRHLHWVYNVLSSVTCIRICSNPYITFVCTVYCRIQSI